MNDRTLKKVLRLCRKLEWASDALGELVVEMPSGKKEVESFAGGEFSDRRWYWARELSQMASLHRAQAIAANREAKQQGRP